MVCSFIYLAVARVPELTGLRRTDSAASVGMVGVPMCAIFDYAMGTPSGHAAFLDPDVNRMLKKILNEWGQYLKVGPFPLGSTTRQLTAAVSRVGRGAW